MRDYISDYESGVLHSRVRPVTAQLTPVTHPSQPPLHTARPLVTYKCQNAVIV